MVTVVPVWRVLRGGVISERELFIPMLADVAALTAGAGVPRVTSGYALPVDKFLDELLAQWREMRPGALWVRQWEGEHPAPSLVADDNLRLALINVLNKAADAAPQPVEVCAIWAPDRLTVEVRDHGPGWLPEAAQAVGKRTYTSKPAGHGMGLGLFLTHAIIERLGGQVAMFGMPSGGSCVRSALPLDSLVEASA